MAETKTKLSPKKINFKNFKNPRYLPELVEKLKTFLPLNLPAIDTKKEQSNSQPITVRYRSNGIREAMLSTGEVVPEVVLILPHETTNTIPCCILIERQFWCAKRNRVMYCCFLGEKTHIPLGFQEKLQQLFFSIKEDCDNDDALQFLEQSFIKDLGFKIAVHPWEDIEKIVENQDC